MSNRSIIGGVLLIVGMSIGAGMLALPTALAQQGFLGGVILLFLGWAVSTFAAFLLLEANLREKPNSNIISMTRSTLGWPGQIAAWITYLLLLYSLLSAMIAGGADVLGGLLHAINVTTAHWINEVLFAGILGFIVYQGIRWVDHINRGLMSVKFIVLFLLIISIVPFAHFYQLNVLRLHHVGTALTVVITSYGFSVVIPSLRTYYHSDIKKLRLIVFIGSLIPLVCYTIWVAVVLGTLPLHGGYSLMQILHSSDPNTQLTNALSYYTHSEWIKAATRVFTSICVSTSFLGVALSLSDFLADGLNVKKQGKGNLLIYTLTFIPPLLVIFFYPAAFIKALSYAGIFCTILLILLPALMVWSGRYYKQLPGDYTVMGGKSMIILTLILAILIIIIPFTPI